MNRIDLIRTDEARVAMINLAPNEISPQHLHSEVVEYVVCLSGCIEVHELDEIARVTKLVPGQVHEIGSRVIHHLINGSATDSEYLLIQNGMYDFVPINS